MEGQRSVELPALGTVLGEDYELQEELGRGGFAVVYRAHQIRLERDIAVKILSPPKSANIDNVTARFLREIDLVKRLEHPNIVRLYDFGALGDTSLWMAMELVRGEELSEVLQRETRFEPERAKGIALQVLSGLAEAHEQTIVHRDLKPSNIMLTRKGANRDWVKILDFGVGKATGDLDSVVDQDITQDSESTFGTPRYMAPEQLQNDNLGPHTDVYAVGLILYEMLCGHPAVQGTTTYELLVRQISEQIKYPSWLDNHLLSHIIRRACEKDHAARYPDALEFYDALAAVDVSDLMPGPVAEVTGSSTSKIPNSLGLDSQPVSAGTLNDTQRAMLSDPTLSQPPPLPGSDRIVDADATPDTPFEAIGDVQGPDLTRRQREATDDIATAAAAAIGSTSGVEPIAPLFDDDAPAALRPPSAGIDKRILLLGGAVAVVILIIALAVIFGGEESSSDTDAEGDTPAAEDESGPEVELELGAELPEIDGATIVESLDSAARETLVEATRAGIGAVDAPATPAAKKKKKKKRKKKRRNKVRKAKTVD